MKILTILLTSAALMAQAQEYLRLTQKDSLYDVEVLVFARQYAQPDASLLKAAEHIKPEPTRVLEPLISEDMLLFALVETKTITEPQEGDDWQVPINEAAVAIDALAWFVIDDSMESAVIDKLNDNPTIKPLLRKKWRQPATDFLSPEYVSVSTSSAIIDDSNLAFEVDSPVGIGSNQLTTEDSENVMIDISSEFSTPDQPDDYAIDGQLAFSKQKFNHIHVIMNMFRYDVNHELITYQINQKSRIQLGEWQYFDHQQFGVMVKVNEIKLEGVFDEE